MQNFKYDVLIGMLHTTRGQKSVRMRANYGNFQATYKDFLSYIIHKGRYGGWRLNDSLNLSQTHQLLCVPTLRFITDQLDDIRLYESLVPMKSSFPSCMNKACCKCSQKFTNHTQWEIYNIVDYACHQEDINPHLSTITIPAIWTTLWKTLTPVLNALFQSQHSLLPQEGSQGTDLTHDHNCWEMIVLSLSNVVKKFDDIGMRCCSFIILYEKCTCSIWKMYLLDMKNVLVSIWKSTCSNHDRNKLRCSLKFIHLTQVYSIVPSG